MGAADDNRIKSILKQTPIPVTFAGASTSSSVEIDDSVPRGLAIEVPVGWTAANIGFEVSREGSLWSPLYDDSGARIQITGVSTTARRVYITPAGAWGIMRYRFVRLASLNTSTGAGVNQTNQCFVSVLA
jgi:hypothetical protein